MSFSNTAKVTVPDNILTQNVRGESVLLNLNDERYFCLDKVGTHMWTALSESESIQTAYEVLLDQYDVKADLLHRDLIDFVEKMVSDGCLEVKSNTG